LEWFRERGIDVLDWEAITRSSGSLKNPTQTQGTCSTNEYPATAAKCFANGVQGKIV
jgi:hypothetical protein